MARWVVAGFALLLPILSACGNDVEKLLPQAKCDDRVWQSDKDSRNAVGLLPDGAESLEVRFREPVGLGYFGHCILRSEGSSTLRGRAWFASRGNRLPGAGTGARFLAAHDMNGPPKKISAAEGVAGVSGAGNAALAVPCSYEREGKSSLFKDGHMIVTVAASDAPDAASSEQRRRAADLALSFLRYAAEKCDEPPTLPKKVRVAG